MTFNRYKKVADSENDKSDSPSYAQRYIQICCTVLYNYLLSYKYVDERVSNLKYKAGKYYPEL